jgi:cytochrome oxidase assembly protein ShyY1
MILVPGQEEQAGKQGNNNCRKQNQYNDFHAFEYIVTEFIKSQFVGWFPYVIGAILVVQFAGLGVWQISRGLDKKAEQEAFSSQSGFSSWSDGMDIRPFQKLKATGHFVADRQVLLENIIVNSQLGYYVITPLRVADDTEVLLVNRGWFPRSGPEVDPDRVAVTDATLTVRGRAGSLPRAGYKMGESFPATPGWPKRAVYPTLDDVAAALGEPVQPFVLLMDPEDEFGFRRHWVPEEMGPGKHYAYALQWFAMGIVLAGLLVWNYRKRGLES